MYFFICVTLSTSSYEAFWSMILSCLMLYWLRFQQHFKPINQAVEIFLGAITQGLKKIFVKG